MRGVPQSLAMAGAFEDRSWGAFVRVEALMDDRDASGTLGRIADFAGRVARALPGVFTGRDTMRAGRS